MYITPSVVPVAFQLFTLPFLCTIPAVPPVNEQDYVTSPPPEKSNQQEASTEPSSADNEIDLSDPSKYCKLCCASFNNPSVSQQHYNGKKHARNELRRKLVEEMEDTGHSMDSGGKIGREHKTFKVLHKQLLLGFNKRLHRLPHRQIKPLSEEGIFAITYFHTIDAFYMTNGCADY